MGGPLIQVPEMMSTEFSQVSYLRMRQGDCHDFPIENPPFGESIVEYVLLNPKPDGIR